MKDQGFFIADRMANARAMQIRVTMKRLMRYLNSLMSQIATMRRSPISMNCPIFIKYLLSMPADAMIEVTLEWSE